MLLGVNLDKTEIISNLCRCSHVKFLIGTILAWKQALLPWKAKHSLDFLLEFSEVLWLGTGALRVASLGHRMEA